MEESMLPSRLASSRPGPGSGGGGTGGGTASRGTANRGSANRSSGNRSSASKGGGPSAGDLWRRSAAEDRATVEMLALQIATEASHGQWQARAGQLGV
jgi:hypothetical protein